MHSLVDLTNIFFTSKSYDFKKFSKKNMIIIRTEKNLFKINKINSIMFRLIQPQVPFCVNNKKDDNKPLLEMQKNYM